MVKIAVGTLLETLTSQRQAKLNGPQLVERATHKEKTMLNFAFMFLLLALVAGLLGVSGVAAIAIDIAWVLFVLGLVLAVIHAVIGRRRL